MEKMEFPERYIKRENFQLHSGEITNVFYDVNGLITDRYYLLEILKKISEGEHYVGIATGGAIIAACASLRFEKPYSMIKDGELKGEIPKKEWILIDDVTTTEASLNEALRIVDSKSGLKPRSIFVVVDRRETKKLNLEAMFKV